jgi:ankyrin repeat protein
MENPLKKQKFEVYLTRNDNEDAKRINNMLMDGLDPDYRDSDGVTLLYQASRQGHLNTAKVLIEHGASVNAVSRNYSTPILAATFGNHHNLVKFLIEKGGDATIRDSVGRSPLVYALICGSYNAAICLAKKGNCLDINMIQDVLRISNISTRNLLLNYVPLFMKESAIQIICSSRPLLLDSAGDPLPAVYEVSRAHISKIVTLDLLLARELCPASPFFRHRFPLDLFKVIFALCELPYSHVK